MRPHFVVALAAALLLSGCASTSDTSSSTTQTPANGSETGVGNGTLEEFTCTAQPGGVVGAGGSNGASVSGCELTQLAQDGEYVSGDIPAGCDVTVDTDGDGITETGATEGENYAKDNLFLFSCSASNPQATGTITIRFV